MTKSTHTHTHTPRHTPTLKKTWVAPLLIAIGIALGIAVIIAIIVVITRWWRSRERDDGDGQPGGGDGQPEEYVDTDIYEMSQQLFDIFAFTPSDENPGNADDVKAATDIQSVLEEKPTEAPEIQNAITELRAIKLFLKEKANRLRKAGLARKAIVLDSYAERITPALRNLLQMVPYYLAATTKLQTEKDKETPLQALINIHRPSVQRRGDELSTASTQALESLKIALAPLT